MKTTLYFRLLNGQWVGARGTAKKLDKYRDTCCFFGSCSMATREGLPHMGLTEEEISKIPVENVE